MANVSVGAVEKVRPRDSIQDSGVASERTMDFENDAGLVRFAQTVLEHFSRNVHGADAKPGRHGCHTRNGCSRTFSTTALV
ncbi:MAG TPA: hypothetical protein VFX83_01155 [Azonexus sp.]|nr:hypothetical protein [Azonexus sp.]